MRRFPRWFYATLVFVLACVGLAMLAPSQAQETPPSSHIVYIPAGDSMALATNILLALPPHTTVILGGGTYHFSYPGSPESPQFPLIQRDILIQGNDAILDFSGYASATEGATLYTAEDATVRFERVNLVKAEGRGRLVVNRGNLTFSDSTLTNVETNEGGGITNYGTLSLIRSAVTNHTLLTDTTPGGALWNKGSVQATCVHFAGNRASQGGAIWNAPGGQLTVSRSVFSGNQANGGGAIFNADTSEVSASDNYWGGDAPTVNETTGGMDTVSERVLFLPFRDENPLTSDPACVPPLVPTISAPATPSPLRINSFVPLPMETSIQALYNASGTIKLLTIYPDRDATLDNLPYTGLVDTPLVSPDGLKVAYTSNRTGNVELYVRTLETNVEYNVSNSVNYDEQNYVWSSDSTRLAFERKDITWVNLSKVAVVTATGSLVWDRNGFYDPMSGAAMPARAPAWSADGQQVYFEVNLSMRVANAATGTEIGILSLPSNNPLNATSLRAVFEERGGTRLFKAYCGIISSGCLGIINTDGTHMRLIGPLTESGFFTFTAPRYTGSGSQLVYRDSGKLYVAKFDETESSGTPLQVVDGVVGRGMWAGVAQIQPTPTRIPDFPVTLTVTCWKAYVNLRATPSIPSDVLAQIPAGTDVQPTGSTDAFQTTFLSISYQGNNGWVAQWEPGTKEILLFATREQAGCPPAPSTSTPTVTSTASPSPTTMATPTLSPTPTLPPPVCQLRVLPNLGTPTPVDPLTPTPTSVPLSGGRHLYDTAIRAKDLAADGIMSTVLPGAILNVYSSDSSLQSVVFVQAFDDQGNFQEGWIDRAYGLEPANDTNCETIPTVTPTYTPTPTSSPTPTLTPTPPLTCQITFVEKRYGFDQWFDADRHGSEQKAPDFTSVWIEISPALNNAGPYLVLQKYLNSNLVQINYPNRPLWIDSSNVQASGDCGATAYPTTIPTLTPGTPISLEIAKCVNASIGIQFDNGLTLTLADCLAINSTLMGVTNIADRGELGRFLWLLQAPSTPAHKLEFRIRLEQFFCVKVVDTENPFLYQHLVNIFLTMLQTNYAFMKVQPGLGSLSATSCRVFGSVQFEHSPEAREGEAAEVIGNRIVLYNKDAPQIPANLIHEIGHYFNARLGGVISNPHPQSPLGRLAAGELNVGGADFSGQVVDLNKARDGMQRDPYTQNGGWTCAIVNGTPDLSCARNEGFADMFMNWVYEQPGSLIFVNDQFGAVRRKFMIDNMANWVCQFGVCN